ncbi:MAG: hypothetical protein IJ572_00460 [Bacilli bacterium]|nr:hypothetical protein [Bacilli bacterium]
MAEKKKTSKEIAKKKFCTNCGKELEEGEKCNCINDVENKKNVSSASSDFEAVLNYTKEMFNDSILMIKKPNTTLNKKIDNANYKNSFILLGVFAFTFAILIAGAFKLIIGLLMSVDTSVLKSSSKLIANINLPYLKIFFYSAIIGFALSMVPIVVAFLTGKIAKSKDFDFKKSTTLVAYSFSSLIYTNLLMLLLLLLNVESLIKVGLIVTLFAYIFCIVTFIRGFVDNVKFNENNKSFAISCVLVASIVVSCFVIRIFSTPMVTDISKNIIQDSSTKISDLLK